MNQHETNEFESSESTLHIKPVVRSLSLSYLEQNLIRCEFCGLEFQDENAAHEHLDYHRDRNPFECVVCGRFFSTKTAFVSHSHNSMTRALFEARIEALHEYAKTLERELMTSRNMIEAAIQAGFVPPHPPDTL